MSMSLKALIIDDDKNLADSLKDILVKQKMDVKITHSAQQAEQLLSYEQYDLLVIDVVLPKVNGVDFLKSIIAKKLLHSDCKVWIISGVINQKIISKKIMDQIDSFIKKPLNLKNIESKVSSLFTTIHDILKGLPFFYLNTTDKVNVLIDNESLIQSHELLFICFYLNSLSFDGVLKIQIVDLDKSAKILFKSGNIINLEIEEPKSYIGGLLVKHNLVDREVIKKLLSEESEIPLGVRLIDGCYVSPHSLNRVLREQMVIRFFSIMKHTSLRVKCEDLDMSSKKFDQDVRLESRDLYMLVNQWVRYYVDIQWLQEFFKTYEDMQFRCLRNFAFSRRLGVYPGLDFFAFDQMKGVQGVSDIIKNSNKEKDQIMRELYCRLLVKEGCLEHVVDEQITSSQDYTFMKKRYESFLKDSENKNYFELLNLPLNASLKEIDNRYRSMVRNFHPDRRGKNMSKDIADICDRCFFLLKKVYEVLSNEKEREKYIAKLEVGKQKSVLAVKSIYMEGKQKLRQGSYAEALSQFESILHVKMSPVDTLLFCMWCRLKINENDMSAEERRDISNMFNDVRIECKKSAVFFFVRGLFMKLEENPKKAFEYFTKALTMDPKLTSARIEQSALGIKVKNKKSSKKSFMSLFKKGA